MKTDPLVYDFFCGLGGWTEGFLSESWRCVGFDIEPQPKYPSEFRLRDVLTIHGREVADADALVFSPPCQEPSYRAMPWSRAKKLNAEGPPHKFIELFEACFRISREADKAGGRHIPMIVENVRGAQRWVGRAGWHFGSYYLWGDVPALMPTTMRAPMKLGVAHRGDETNFHGYKVPSSRFDGSGRSFQSESVKVAGINLSRVGFNAACVRKVTHGDPNMTMAEGRQTAPGNGVRFTSYGCGVERGVKGFTPNGEPLAKNTLGRAFGSKSHKRKEASALIAKIPFPLARHIAQAFKPLVTA